MGQLRKKKDRNLKWSKFRNKYLLFIVLLFVNIYGYTQDTLTFFTSDKLTYQQFTENKWEELIKTGKESIEQGIDYYYLRVRLGIAYYNQKNYHQSIYQLEKALKINSTEDYIKEYLYYSYLYSGRTKEAQKYCIKDNPKLPKNNICKDYFIQSIDFSISSQSNLNESELHVDDIAFDEGSQYIPLQTNFYGFGLTHKITQWLSATHSIGRVNLTYLELTKYMDIATFNNNYKVQENLYYLSLLGRIAKNWYFNAGMHRIGNQYFVDQEVVRRGQATTETITVNDNDYVFFGSVHKQLPLFDLIASVSNSTLNNSKQWQEDFSLRYFPFGNLHVYLFGKLSILQHTNDGMKKSEIIFNPLLGLKIVDYLWLEGSYLQGDIYNYSSENRFVVYNGPEIIQNIAKLKFIVPIKAGLQLYIDNTYVIANSYTISTLVKTNKIQSNYYQLTGGLSWKL